MVKRERGPAFTIYVTEEQRDAWDKAATDAGLSRLEWLRRAADAATDGMVLPPELSRHVRAEARRLKVPAEHVLAGWILDHVGKDGE